MRIEDIHVERFGRHVGLALSGLSDHMNVVYGPNGSGKTTLLRFVRWMLFGNTDESVSNLLNETAGTTAGSATVVQDGLRRRLSRQDDGTRWGRLSVDNQPFYAGQDGHLTGLLNSLSAYDFDRIYAPGFTSEPDLVALLQAARSRGMELTTRREPTERVQQLRLKIDGLRRDLERMPWLAHELSYLIDHRNSLQRRIGQLEDDARRRRVHSDREYEELNRQIEDMEAEIARLRSDWHTRDNDVTARRRELEEAWQVAEEARQEFLRSRRNQLVELENNLDRARSMLTEFQRRGERLERDLRDQHLQHESKSPADDTLCLVQTIANQLDDMRKRPELVGKAPVYRSDNDYRSTVPTSMASLDALRNEVGRLCNVLRTDREDNKTDSIANELSQLQQCEQQIEQWTANLAKQRDQLATELDEAERFGVALVADEHPLTDAAEYGYVAEAPTNPRKVRAVLHSCDGYQPIDPASDELLLRLTSEREMVSRDLETLERRLRQLLDRRRELELSLHRLNDHEVAAARRELANIETKIRNAEERDRVQREIERLEGELARVRDDIVPSHITSHASELIREMTGGRYVDVRVTDPRTIMLEEANGHLIPHGQLSRGVRDQVYLGFCMAIIAAFRRQGIELPMVLSDAFINIDSDRDDLLAAVVSGFARQGHQVILMTRHRHVVELFRKYEARFFELGPITRAEPMVTNVVDEVRFRPYDSEPRVAPPAPVRVQRTDQPRWNALRHGEAGRVSFVRGEGHRPNVSRYQQLNESEVELRHNASRANFVVLSGATPLDATGVLDAESAARLRTVNLVTVDDFLRCAPEFLSQQLDRLGVGGRPWQRWRDEIALRSVVANLTREDAHLLVVSGVTNVYALAGMTIDELKNQITRFANSGHGSAELRSYAARIGESALGEWIHAARLAGSATHINYDASMEQAPRFERIFDRDNDAAPLRRDTNDDYGSSYGTSADDYGADYSRSFRGSARTRGVSSTEYQRQYRRQSERRLSDAEPTIVSELAPTTASPSAHNVPLPDNDVAITRNRTRRRSNREGRGSGASTSNRSGSTRRSSRKTARTSSTSLRFHLHRNDAVVDAPSIGARTADKLRVAGITTVGDLLSANAAALAEKLDDGRISAETIKLWQAQTTLCCRIPEIRGHDAQILVACDISDPDKLAKMGANELWSIVGPFAKSADGKRIIRGGKAPDLNEVKDWIVWAQQSRSLASS